jgi:DNA-binding IclR family transcriptional regulator
MFCSIKRYRVLIIRTLQSIQIDPDRSGSIGIGTESEMAAAATVDKALDLLFRLHEESSPMGVTALGLALGVPKSSAHRLLASLCRRGLVEQDDRGRYRPGIGLVALGLGALEREPLVAAARPVLEAEALALGETVFLVVARAGRLVVLDKAEGTGFLRAAPRVGSEVPLHATAVGKLFLALDPAAVKRPPGDPERFTEHTLRGLALDRAVALARERGFAESREEWIPGLCVIAAPVEARGVVRAALAVAAPAPRMTAMDPAEVARRAVAAAERVSARLEGRES